jgi:low affinity Fe/Cu permease
MGEGIRRIIRRHCGAVRGEQHGDCERTDGPPPIFCLAETNSLLECHTGDLGRHHLNTPPAFVTAAVSAVKRAPHRGEERVDALQLVVRSERPSPVAFAVVCGIVLLWALTGPLFGYSDTRQLVINTGTTIITFLMVFLIQHTQNRDSRALQLKLDELLRSLDAARNKLINLENCTDAEIDQIERQFKALRTREKRQK